MKFIRRNIKIISILIILILITSLILLKLYLMNNQEQITEIKEDKNELIINEPKKEEIKIKKVYVDIKGAVVNPGVYEIEENKKVIDVVNEAGGLTKNADTSMINLAKVVTNEMVIIIYTKEEVKKYQKQEEIIKIIDKECICPEIKNDACINNQLSNPKESNKNNNQTIENNSNKKININTASKEELQTLTGIGESKAEAIIEYRQKNGNFKTIEEIKEVSGIGESAYEKIKDYITI